MIVLQVFIMRNGAFEGTEMVSGDRIDIGRDPSCALVLEDESCSRRHAVIFEHDGKLAIQDAGSANGTRVNGEPVPRARYIGPRDDIAIGVFTLKVKPMAAEKRAPPQQQPLEHNPTRVLSVPAPVGQLTDPARTEALQASSSASDERTAVAAPPPPPPVSDESISGEAPTRPSFAPRGLRPTPAPQPLSAAGRTEALQDVTAPDGRVPPPAMPVDLRVPDVADAPAMSFQPRFLLEELVEEDEDPPWSLVQRLVRTAPEKHKSALIEVVHYRGETVVDHQVVHEGETYRLGERWTRAERRERGLPKPVPIVRLKKGGVAEIFQHADVQGRLLRNGQQVELQQSGGATPITDGEVASLKLQNERLFVRFAGAPQLVWTKEDAAEDRFTRRVNTIASGSSIGLFVIFAVVGWIYQYRNAAQEVIALADEGFAEVLIMDDFTLKEEPEPQKVPEPIEAPDPVPQQKPDKQTPSTAAPKQDAPPETKPAKPGVLDILNSIPKIDDPASSQNLNAALSNIKGVRVPGAAAGVKVSSLIDKAPSSGVQIGGGAGGLQTNGSNSLLRKDGAAGALGGKGDRAIAGKVTTLTRQTQTKGQGELSKEEILKVINSHIGEIQYCYEKQLRLQPGLAGRVVLEWTVKPDGRVQVVKVANSELGSAQATQCMSDKVKNWVFPKPRGGAVTIIFPFVFNSV